VAEGANYTASAMSAPPLAAVRVCLVNPPVIDVVEPWYDTPPYGRPALACLAGYLRRFNGFEVSIIDAKFERLSFDEVLDRLSARRVDVVGLTAFTNEIKPAAYLAHRIRKRAPRVTTVIGGVHVSAIPQATLREFPAFDIGVVGEGEITFHDLCAAIRAAGGAPSTATLGEIEGLVFRDGAHIRLTRPRERVADLDSLRLPAWDLMPRADTYIVQASRGCPFRCPFCFNPNGRSVRKRSVTSVMEEVSWLLESFRPRRLSFADEIFGVDRRHAEELLAAMVTEHVGERVAWDVQTHARFVDRQLFEAFKRAGVDRVEMSVETGDEEMLRRMKKGLSRATVLSAFQAAKEADVTTGAFFLFGQPDETLASMRKTVALAVEVNPDLPMFGLMVPYPGTAVADMAAKGERGYRLLTTDWDRYNKQTGGVVEFAELTNAQIQRFQARAYLTAFLANGRYRDIFAFGWEYRHGILALAPGLFGGRRIGSGGRKRPTDYARVLSEGRE
jgi:anaerobic magnesium-protoporphyrin IX monomethyl ester cyclase